MIIWKEGQDFFNLFLHGNHDRIRTGKSVKKEIFHESENL